MPLFVKPLRSDASIGIDGKSLVHDAAALMERVRAIRKELNDAALAEEFIDGREFYVGVLGNSQPKALPPIEMDFTGLPRGRAQGDGQQGQVGRAEQGVQGHQLGAGRAARRAAGAAPEGGGGRLPRAARARLRPRRPPPDRHRRHLRDRGQRELLPGAGQRVRDGRGGGGTRLSEADRADRGSGAGAVRESSARAYAATANSCPAARGSSPAPSPASSARRSPRPPGRRSRPARSCSARSARWRSSTRVRSGKWPVQR